MPILSYQNEISFRCKKLNSVSYEWLCTRPRFDREAYVNLEMGYSISSSKSANKVQTVVIKITSSLNHELTLRP